ncbi:MAG: amidohydrolase family protein [Candidatus Eremiobacteraeota bacterium]|nr:amidohydrolase family protein [Candidatus Eremiobacteraeota bacterium]
MKYKLIRSRFLIPVNDRIGREKRIEDGFVLIENDMILDFGQYNAEIGKNITEKYKNELTIIGSKDNNTIPLLECAVLPGFVKAHGHDHESPIIGVAKDVPLTPWLDEAVNLFTGFINKERQKLEEHFSKSPNLVTYLKARVDDIYFGITSSMAHHCNFNKYYVDEIVEANTRAGTKMIVAVGSQNRNYGGGILDIPPEIAIERLDEYQERFSNVERIEIIPGPDQFFSNGPELLKALKAWANKRGKLFHIHSSEEPNTTAWFRKEYGMTPVEYGDDLGIMDENTVVAHQVHNTEDDLEILRRTGTKVVHNPLANTILGSGMPPIIRMMEMGIPVAISTDGSGSADSQNILSAARCAAQYQKAYHQDASLLHSQKLIEMITIIPAKILKLNAGTIEKGYDADITAIDITRPNLTPSRIDNVVENLIWASDGSEARYVIANGKILKDDYKFVTLDKDTILREVKELSELLMEYRKTAKEITGTGAHR